MPSIRSARQPETQPDEAYHLTQRQVSRVEMVGDWATVINMRDGHYGPDQEPDIRWRDQAFDLAELTNVYFMINGGWGAVRGIAHAMLGFEFADSANVVLSTEAILPDGGKYSIGAGLRRTYPLRNIWSSEGDALLSRAFKSSKVQVGMFPVRLTQRQGVEIFKAAAHRTNELIASPEWYNAAGNSCSTNVASLVDDALPGQRTRSLRYMLPGYLPELFVRKGLIRVDDDLHDLSTLITEFDVLPAARTFNGCVDFSARLHDRTQNQVGART